MFISCANYDNIHHSWRVSDNVNVSVSGPNKETVVMSSLLLDLQCDWLDHTKQSRSLVPILTAVDFDMVLAHAYLTDVRLKLECASLIEVLSRGGQFAGDML